MKGVWPIADVGVPVLDRGQVVLGEVVAAGDEVAVGVGLLQLAEAREVRGAQPDERDRVRVRREQRLPSGVVRRPVRPSRRTARAPRGRARRTATPARPTARFSSTGKPGKQLPEDHLAGRRLAAELLEHLLTEDATGLRPSAHRRTGRRRSCSSRLNCTTGTPDSMMSFSPLAIDSPGTDVASPSTPAATSVSAAVSWASASPPAGPVTWMLTPRSSAANCARVDDLLDERVPHDVGDEPDLQVVGRCARVGCGGARRARAGWRRRRASRRRSRSTCGCRAVGVGWWWSWLSSGLCGWIEVEATGASDRVLGPLAAPPLLAHELVDADRHDDDEPGDERAPDGVDAEEDHPAADHGDDRHADQAAP